MIYHGFYIKITPMKNIQREKADGTSINCDGFNIEVFYDSSENIPIDVFTAAEGYEIFKNNMEDAEQFVKDVIESEEKEYLRIISEFKNSTDT